MAGYSQHPDQTAEVLRDRLLHTGDVGHLDHDGYLFLANRIKDLILCGGYNVYPRVIEDALYEHPAIAEAVVVGVPDPYRGEAPKAFVTLKADASTDPEQLRAFLANRISKIGMPREIEVRDDLPKTLIGKLSRMELRAERAAPAAPSPQPARRHDMATTLQTNSRVSDDERAVRVDLAAAYRLVALYGWNDLIFTHLSARVPGPEHHFLINPYTHMFEEITASSLVKIDVEGRKVDDTPAPDARQNDVLHGRRHLDDPIVATDQTTQLSFSVLPVHTPEIRIGDTCLPDERVVQHRMTFAYFSEVPIRAFAMPELCGLRVGKGATSRATSTIAPRKYQTREGVTCCPLPGRF